MSQKSAYKITCPKCGHEQPVELYEAVNVQEEPELKLQLMANELNAVACEKCKLSFRVDKPLLYSDPKQGLMVYLIPLSEDNFTDGERQFTESLQKLNSALPDGVEAPDVSLVFNRAELVERIFLFEAGLNERIIEYVKYLIYSKNLDKVDPMKKNLLFNVEDSNDESLCFVVQDAESKQLEAMLQYDRKTYDALVEMFDQDEQTSTLLELFPGPYISARALFLQETKSSGTSVPESAE